MWNCGDMILGERRSRAACVKFTQLAVIFGSTLEIVLFSVVGVMQHMFDGITGGELVDILKVNLLQYSTNSEISVFFCVFINLPRSQASQRLRGDGAY